MMQLDNDNNNNTDRVLFKVSLKSSNTSPSFEEEEAETRIVAVPSGPIAFAALQAQVCQQFNISLDETSGGRLKLLYKDEEEDWITISSDEEVEMVVRLLSSSSSSPSTSSSSSGVPAVIRLRAVYIPVKSGEASELSFDDKVKELLARLPSRGEDGHKGCKGPRRYFKAAKLLEKFNGDVDLAAVQFQLKCKHKLEKHKYKQYKKLHKRIRKHHKKEKKKCHGKRYGHGWSSSSSSSTSSSSSESDVPAIDHEKVHGLLAELESKGFTHKRLNFHLLRKFDYDVAKVIEVLNRKAAWHKEGKGDKKWKHHHHDHGHHHGHGKKHHHHHHGHHHGKKCHKFDKYLWHEQKQLWKARKQQECKDQQPEELEAEVEGDAMALSTSEQGAI